MATDLLTVTELESALRVPQGSLVDDPYAELIISAASEAVRDAADQPGWVGSGANHDLGEVNAPTRAKHIAIWVAKRAFEDKGNLQSRASGPIKNVYFENGIRALELTAAEEKYLEGQRPGGGRNGFWVLHMGAGSMGPPPRDLTPDGRSFERGDENISHGMTFGDPTW